MSSIAVGGRSPAGLRWPHYFNGRLLTAQDLEATHDAVHTRDRWLGTAIGPGVASGLVVTGSPGDTKLNVTDGIGITPCGTAVQLASTAVLDLTVVSSVAPVVGSMFADCRPTDAVTSAPSAGAYLLAMSPSSAFDGKVPVQGSSTAALPTPCGSRWEVEGVVFKAILLDDFPASVTGHERRNRLAHWCFGSEHLRPLAMSGFTDPVPHRGIDGLADLGDCDVPLAVFDWDGAELGFVDLWSARRRPVRPSAATLLGAVVGDERLADGEARFLQFQDQLAALLSTAAGRARPAAEVFPTLPPAGILPIDPSAAVALIDERSPEDDLVAVVEDSMVATDKRADKVRHVRAQTRTRGDVGSISQLVLDLAADVQALHDEVDELSAAVRGRAVADPLGPERQRRRDASLEMTSLLADNPGDGVDLAVFLAGLRVRLGVIDADGVDAMIRSSWCQEPVEVDKSSTLDVLFVVDRNDAAADYVLFVKPERRPIWFTDAEHMGGRW